MLGQLGLALMKALKREKSSEPSSLRKITHSTSLRASESVMEFAIAVASSWRFLRTKSSACFTADRSSGDVAVVAAMANGKVVRAAGLAEARAWTAEDADDEVADSMSGASDNGPLREAVDCWGPIFGCAARSGLAVLPAGRSRGSGMGSDDSAISAITRLKPRVTTAIGQKGFTIPPRHPLPLIIGRVR